MVQIRVAGNIIREISAIPKGNLALIELIKNAYEAKANNVEIKLARDYIIVQDDGTGMNNSGIEALLQISHSSKIFGEKIPGTNRYISGEKGLGFFSVFRFGRNVQIDTTRDNKKVSFELDLSKLEKQENISEYDVQTYSSTVDSNEHGTQIRISNLDYDFYDAFRENIQRDSSATKLCNSIDDEDFKVTIKIDDKNTGGEGRKPSTEFIKHRIAKAYLDERKNLIIQKYDGNNKEKSKQISLKLPDNELMNNSEFKLEIDLEFYRLKGLGIKHAPRIYRINNKLEPLIFINNVLFDATSDLYDIEINTKMKSAYVFRQQIGKIKIFLQDPRILKFNADRTKIVENKYLDDLKNILDFISKEAQIAIYDLTKGNETKNVKFKKNKLQEINVSSSDKNKDSSDLSKEIIENKNNDFNVLPNKTSEIKNSYSKKKKEQNRKLIKINKIGSKQKYYSNYLEIPGYKGKTYEFENLYNVGHLISELKNLDIEKNPLLSLIVVRPMYEACKNLMIKEELLDDNDSSIRNVKNAICKIKERILGEKKADLSKLCKKNAKNGALSYSTTLTTFKNTDFGAEVEISNIFIHRVEEKVETPENIKSYLQNALLFTVLVDRYVSLKKGSNA